MIVASETQSGTSNHRSKTNHISFICQATSSPGRYHRRVTPPLTAAPRRILFGWVVVVMVAAAMVAADVAEAGGYADLVLVVGVVLGLAALGGILLTWALVRYAISAPAGRVIVALLGPPALLMAAIGLLRLL